MRFYLPTGQVNPLDKAGKVEGVQCIRIDTGSIVPRSNRKHIRQVLVQGLGIKPCFVKYVMKQMSFWTPERLGVPCTTERYKLYAEAIKYAKDSERQS